MTDYCPRCAGLLTITWADEQWHATCSECHKPAAWNDTLHVWEPTVNRRFLLALATTLAVLLWIAGHAEVIT